MWSNLIICVQIFSRTYFIEMVFSCLYLKWFIYQAVIFYWLCLLVKVAFIPYITAGDPDLSTTAQALKVLASCGSDIIELGVPYSDPLADGPVIQVWYFNWLFFNFLYPIYWLYYFWYMLCLSLIGFALFSLLIHVSFSLGCSYTFFGKRHQFWSYYFNVEGGMLGSNSILLISSFFILNWSILYIQYTFKGESVTVQYVLWVVSDHANLFEWIGGSTIILPSCFIHILQPYPQTWYWKVYGHCERCWCSW